MYIAKTGSILFFGVVEIRPGQFVYGEKRCGAPKRMCGKPLTSVIYGALRGILTEKIRQRKVSSPKSRASENKLPNQPPPPPPQWTGKKTAYRYVVSAYNIPRTHK